MNKYLIRLLPFALLLFHVHCKSRHQPAAGISLTNYQLVPNWPSLPANYVLGNPTGIDMDTAQNLVVFHRAGREWPFFGSMPSTFIDQPTIAVVDRKSGRLLHSWGDSLFIMPHGLTVDQHNNIWVTDVGLHQVFKFSYDGRLLMQLGTAQQPGNDSLHFDQPTDVAVAPDGSFYIADGYGNSRVIKFNAAGQYQFQWGTAGKGQGQFDIPHGIALDQHGLVYVADRENSRVQVFDSTGRFMKAYNNQRGGKVYAVTLDKTARQLVASDYITNYIKPRGSDIILFDSAGTRLGQFGRSSHQEGPTTRIHDVVVDREGNIFACDILKNRLQQFSKQDHEHQSSLQ